MSVGDRDDWGPFIVQLDGGGYQLSFGPFPGLAEAMRFVSEHVPDGDVERYRHTYLDLIDPTLATSWLRRAPGPRWETQPLAAAAAERITAHHGERGESDTGDVLYAHLDSHRPWPVALAAPDCLDDACEHDRDRRGHCTAEPIRRVLCRACTPTAISGEYAGEPLVDCSVDWPCSAIAALAAAYQLPRSVQHAIWPIDLDGPQPALPFTEESS